jgi:alpha-beta hydrolase superfamily lysophospholipase
MKKAEPKRRIRLWVTWIAFALVFQFILINISAALHAYKLTHLHNAGEEVVKQAPANIFSRTWRLFSGPTYYNRPLADVPPFAFSTIILQTSDSIPIEAWYCKTDSISKGAVILFHGLSGNKGMLLSEAGEFRSLGYNVFLVDLRDHGHSGGDVFTYGYRESEEVKLAYDYIAQTGEKNIFLWGASLGAVEVAKAVYDYDLSLSGLIIEMPFLSLQSHLEWRARSLNFPQQPFAFFTCCWIGFENGFNGLGLRADKYVKKIHCPVLMQYGKKDGIVSSYETESVFKAIASGNKKLVEYENAGHESLFRNDPVTWTREMKDFLK